MALSIRLSSEMVSSEMVSSAVLALTQVRNLQAKLIPRELQPKPEGFSSFTSLSVASKLAAEPGFEPGLEDSKSPVLPLHNSASYYSAEGRARTDMEVAPQQFLRLSRLPIPPLRLIAQMERKTRFELATSSLARRRSTAELLPHSMVPRPRIELGTRGFSVRCSTD